MQVYFQTDLTPKEYAAKGVDGEFPVPEKCYTCSNNKLHKHGFYWRYCLDGFHNWYIPIRRYYCTYCKTTTSMLPNFCLPRFQYSFAIIADVILLRIFKLYSLNKLINVLSKRFPRLRDWSISQANYYANRFIKILPHAELVLRSRAPDCCLNNKEEDKKRAKKVLDIALERFSSLKLFAVSFQKHCQSSFLDPHLRFIVP